MEDRYAKAMEQAERVLQNVAERSERALQTMASRTPEAKAAAKRERQRRAREAAKRAKRIFYAVLAIFLGAMVVGIITPIGIMGGLAALMLALFATIMLAIYPKSRAKVTEVQALSNAEVVHRLDALLIRERPALPHRALPQVDAISTQLPLLEKRLETLDGLDPLAQDARRLMGQHLPDLIQRYERVPPTLRQERDAEGLSVEDRLLRGLGAARQAIDDMGKKLAESDISAFETQGRFLESRYKDGEVG